MRNLKSLIKSKSKGLPTGKSSEEVSNRQGSEQMGTFRTRDQETRATEEPTIRVRNSFCEVLGFPPAALEVVRTTLTYENQEAVQELRQARIQLAMAFRYKNFKKVGILKVQVAEAEANMEVCWFKDGQFPTGHLSLVLDALQPFVPRLEDLRVNNAAKVSFPWKVPPKTPRYYQAEMLPIAIAEGRGVWECAVGTGKTFLMELIINALQVPTLILVPSKDLAVQTAAVFVEAFGKSKVELITSITKADTSKPLRICTIHTLTALLKKDLLEPFLAPLGMICIDEAHHAGSVSFTNLLPSFDHIYYRFLFSGTFIRNDSKTLDMWGFSARVLYKYPASLAVKDGFLVPSKAIVHQIEGRPKRNYQSEYKANYCGNEALLDAIGTILTDYVQDGEATLILVQRKDQSGKVIHEHLNAMGIENVYISGDSEGEDIKDAILAFNDKRIRVLIGSSIIGEGIDIKATDHLIMAQGGKSGIAIPQAIGRAIRLYPGKSIAYIHDFRFIGTKYLEKHLTIRTGLYESDFGSEVLDVGSSA